MKNATVASQLETHAASAKRGVLLVEDHPVTRMGMRAIIDQQPDLGVVAETDNGPHALELVTTRTPDVAVIDITLKTTNGIELAKHIGAVAPSLPILVVSMHNEGVYAERALRAGAHGFLMKQEAADRVITAIRKVLNGELYVSDAVHRRLLENVVHKKASPHSFPIDTLSDREMEVFRLIGQGFGTREIAQKLILSAKTIDSYREHLKLKLNLHSGAELVRHAIEWGRDMPPG